MLLGLNLPPPANKRPISLVAEPITLCHGSRANRETAERFSHGYGPAIPHCADRRREGQGGESSGGAERVATCDHQEHPPARGPSRRAAVLPGRPRNAADDL